MYRVWVSSRDRPHVCLPGAHYRIAESPNRRGAHFAESSNREARPHDSARFDQPCLSISLDQMFPQLSNSLTGSHCIHVVLGPYSPLEMIAFMLELSCNEAIVVHVGACSLLSLGIYSRSWTNSIAFFLLCQILAVLMDIFWNNINTMTSSCGNAVCCSLSQANRK